MKIDQAPSPVLPPPCSIRAVPYLPSWARPSPTGRTQSSIPPKPAWSGHSTGLLVLPAHGPFHRAILVARRSSLIIEGGPGRIGLMALPPLHPVGSPPPSPLQAANNRG